MAWRMKSGGVVLAVALLAACTQVPTEAPAPRPPAAPAPAPLPPGAPAAQPPPPSPTCIAHSCAELGLRCGTAEDDGCGQALACGACAEAAAETAPRCSPQTGWCWENFPDGAMLRAVLALARDQAWAVGEGGLILHWDGRAWTPVRSNVEVSLGALWASGPRDVWAAGDDGLVVHWDGVRWSPVRVGGRSAALSVTGTSARDVWVQRRQELLHWDGAQWTVHPTLEFATQVRALAPGLLIGVGDFGCQWFRDGRWEDAQCGLWGASSVWASSATDVWAVAAYRGEDGGRSSGAVAHWDGAAWSVESLEQPALSVFGFQPGDVWINGSLHYDGKSWTRRSERDFLRLAGSSSQDLWAMDGARLWHFDGTAWRTADAREVLVLNSIGTTEEGEVWATGWGGTLLTREGSRWTRTETRGPSSLQAAFGASLDDLWGWDTPMRQLWHWDGVAWRTVATEGFAGVGWALPGGSVTVPSRTQVGDKATLTAHRWNGTGWTPETFDLGVDLQALAETSSDGLWAVGFERPAETPVVWRRDGMSWTKVYAADWRGHLGVFATSPGDLWASGYEEPVGGSTTWVTLHWNGSTFERSGPRGAFVLAGTGPRDVWAGLHLPETPSRFSLLHFDGTDWRPAGRLPLDADLWTATPGGRTYAISMRGAVFSHPAP